VQGRSAWVSSGRDGELGEPASQPLGGLPGLGRAGVGQQRAEFLAAEPADQVIAQQPAQGGEHGVAGEVAVAVVDLLEVVDAQHGQGERGCDGTLAQQSRVRITSSAGGVYRVRSKPVRLILPVPQFPATVSENAARMDEPGRRCWVRCPPSGCSASCTQ
jgi:hypothetical protein